MKFDTFRKLFQKEEKETKETLKNKLTPLTSEEWSTFFSGKETKIKIGDNNYYINLHQEEDQEETGQSKVLLVTEDGNVFCQLRVIENSYTNETYIELGMNNGEKLEIAESIKNRLQKNREKRKKQNETQRNVTTNIITTFTGKK